MLNINNLKKAYEGDRASDQPQAIYNILGGISGAIIEFVTVKIQAIQRIN